MQRISQRVFRASLSGALLALLVLLTFNVGTTQAAGCGGLTATPLDAGTDCFVKIPYIEPTAGTLTYTADANLTITGATGGDGSLATPYTYTYDGADHGFPISFHTTVSDTRGSLTGWNLSASTDLDSTVAKITLDPSTPTTIGSNTTGCTSTSTCSPTFGGLSKASSGLTLSSGPKAFVGAPTISSGGAPNTGAYAITTPGTLTILSSAPAGTAVTGSITLTLSNVAFGA